MATSYWYEAFQNQQFVRSLTAMAAPRYLRQCISTCLTVYCMHLTNSSTEFDESGHQECLRFPPFRQEMLLNTWWSAGEDIGRVKVVITEGLARSQGPPMAFRRTKNVVSFSFQHAPLGKA